MVDAFWKWVEVLLVTTSSAGTTIAVLPQVFAAQGLLDIIGSDNGPAFASTEYLAWMTRNGIRRIPFCVKPSSLRQKVQPNRWCKPSRTSSKRASLGFSGRRLSGYCFYTGPRLTMSLAVPPLKQKLAADQGCRPGPLPESGAPVFTKNFCPDPPWSAGQVVSPGSASSLLVRMPDGATWHRHTGHVRPRLGTGPAYSTATSELQPTGG
ncbi:uncharacterized protein [Dermacentor albipictus]|uniref:uncharacterized protein n=1 Tax=Dermacentor albipictus TaxID=60249 RepID=UPI0038FC0CD1